MILIVGLGNPGKKYKNTRHNVGFNAIDKIAANFQFGEPPGSFNFQSKFNAEISKGEINGKKVILAKPQTFMNESGEAINSLITNSEWQIENLIIIHDDIDLPIGKIKIVKNRGAGGHKGVESIIKKIKTNDFIRLRIGIMPENGKPENLKNFVIKIFSKDEKEKIKEVIEKTIKIINVLINKGVEKAMNEYNK